MSTDALANGRRAVGTDRPASADAADRRLTGCQFSAARQNSRQPTAASNNNDNSNKTAEDSSSVTEAELNVDA